MVLSKAGRITLIFETDRLVARRLVLGDEGDMAQIYGDRSVVRFVGDGEPLDLPGCLGWIEVTDRNFEKRGYGMVALVAKETGRMVGCAGIVHPDQQPEPEIKYALRRDAWGKGYATESVSAFLHHGLENLALPEIMATVHPGNTASQKVLTKAGMALIQMRRNDDESLTQVWIRRKKWLRWSTPR